MLVGFECLRAQDSLLWRLPEHLLEDMLEVIMYLTRFNPSTLGTTQLHPLMTTVSDRGGVSPKTHARAARRRNGSHVVQMILWHCLGLRSELSRWMAFRAVEGCGSSMEGPVVSFPLVGREDRGSSSSGGAGLAWPMKGL